MIGVFSVELVVCGQAARTLANRIEALAYPERR
jgi:hypothetical protein